jgi:hypothetical protein
MKRDRRMDRQAHMTSSLRIYFMNCVKKKTQQHLCSQSAQGERIWSFGQNTFYTMLLSLGRSWSSCVHEPSLLVYMLTDSRGSCDLCEILAYCLYHPAAPHPQSDGDAKATIQQDVDRRLRLLLHGALLIYQPQRYQWSNSIAATMEKSKVASKSYYTSTGLWYENESQGRTGQALSATTTGKIFFIYSLLVYRILSIASYDRMISK